MCLPPVSLPACLPPVSLLLGSGKPSNESASHTTRAIVGHSAASYAARNASAAKREFPPFQVPVSIKFPSTFLTVTSIAASSTFALLASLSMVLLVTCSASILTLLRTAAAQDAALPPPAALVLAEAGLAADADSPRDHVCASIPAASLLSNFTLISGRSIRKLLATQNPGEGVFTFLTAKVWIGVSWHSPSSRPRIISCAEPSFLTQSSAARTHSLLMCFLNSEVSACAAAPVCSPSTTTKSHTKLGLSAKKAAIDSFESPHVTVKRPSKSLAIISATTRAAVTLPRSHP
mmetsp:Transcript_19236/g.29738  ORF Transcript_19236/g.29738 Transcript_19236/m.29738 type:complete len:291 (+) Transcript_19236:1365-2237(+)